jgi:hypothetical protein
MNDQSRRCHSSPWAGLARINPEYGANDSARALDRRPNRRALPGALRRRRSFCRASSGRSDNSQRECFLRRGIGFPWPLVDQMNGRPALACYAEFELPNAAATDGAALVRDVVGRLKTQASLVEFRIEPSIAGRRVFLQRYLKAPPDWNIGGRAVVFGLKLQIRHGASDTRGLGILGQLKSAAPTLWRRRRPVHRRCCRSPARPKWYSSCSCRSRIVGCRHSQRNKCNDRRATRR